MSTNIDFDSKDGLKLFRAAYQTAYDDQSPRDQQYERDYQNFHAFLDMTNRNPDRSNIAIPKIFSVIMTKAPREIKAAIGRRPYIPFDAKRDEYKDAAKKQAQMLDQLLYIGGFPMRFATGGMIKMTYGTSFMEALPYFEDDVQRGLVPQTVDTPNGPAIVGWAIQNVPVKRLRFQLTTYAPWEIKVDPYATDLETPGGCRYIIKVRIASKREIKRIAESGGYGSKFDLGVLDAQGADYGSELLNHTGLNMLRNMGLPDTGGDGDIGVLFRYESPERYIDVWNDNVVLRDSLDGGHPFDKMAGGHGLINLSRMVHNIDPHTQSQFWGNGEVKINELQCDLLNDILNNSMDNANFLNMGKTYYAESTGVSPDMLVHAMGNKIPVKLVDGQRIQDVIYEDRGESLPSDFYNLRDVVERYIDVTANHLAPNNGESPKGDATLGEISLLKEAGDSREELNVKLLEDPFLKDFGHKCLCHMDQFARTEDKIEFMGEEAAQMMLMLNPRDLPGGYNFTFNGSDRVVNQIIKQRNLMDLSAHIENNPYVKPREWVRVLFEAYDLGDEVDKVLLTDEDAAMLAVGQRQLDRQDAEARMATSGPSSSGGGSSLPQDFSMARQATDNGRQLTQDAKGMG